MLRRSVGRRVVFRLPESKDTAERAGAGRGSAPAPAARRPRHLHARPARRSIPADVVVADPTLPPRPPERPRAGDAPPGLLHRRRVLAGELPGGARRPSDARVTGHARCWSRSRSAPRMPKSSSWPARSGGPSSRRRRRRADGARGLEAAACDGTTRPRASSGWASSTSTRFPGQQHAPARASPPRSRCSSRPQVKYERTYVVRGTGALLGHPPAAGRGERGAGRGDLHPQASRARPSSAIGRCPAASPGCTSRTAPAGRSWWARPRWSTRPRARTSGSPPGTAFDLTARRVQTSYVTRRDSTKAGGVRTVATADYRVTRARTPPTAPPPWTCMEERAGEWTRAEELGPGGEASSTIDPLPGEGARPRRGRADLPLRIVW